MKFLFMVIDGTNPVGDIIIFESLSDDGWGDATNETSGEKGKVIPD